MTMLDAGLEVRRVEQRDDGWAHIVCANDWAAWVDGRRLESLAGEGESSASDYFDLEVFAVLRDAVGQYQRLLDEFTAGRIDEVEFRRQAVRIGLVVRETDAWILELPTERWWRYDGVQLTTIELPDDSTLGG